MSAELHIVGKSNHVLQLRKQVAKLAVSRKDALIVGEAGVGKSMLASLIAAGEQVTTFSLSHQNESELQAGLSAVTSGTVLFEEMEEAGLRIQDLVLGYIDSRAASVRLIATLTLQTKQLLVQQKLSENLCARLNAFDTIEIRPLRERPEDIPLLVKSFANGLIIDINTLETLVKLPWKGNIRQLKSVIEQCISTASDGKFVLPEELVDERTEVAKMLSGLVESQRPILEKSLDAIEHTIFTRALERFGFSESKAAQFLGMTEQTFGEKLKRLALVRSSAR